MKQAVLKLLKKSLKELKVEAKDSEIESNIEIPPNLELGDYSFPCFFLSAKLKTSPNAIAVKIKEKIGKIPAEEIEEIKIIGPYVNFFVNRKNLAKQIVEGILKQKEKFGKPRIKSEKVMIEFSQANTHKAFHVGHIRGTSIGESLARIYEFCGSRVTRANYQGDTGMHVAKWLWCYKKYHSKEKIRNDEAWIASIYVDAVKKITSNEKLQEEVDVVNQKLTEGKDKPLNALWKKTRKLSLDSLEKIYKELNTKFNVYFFESETEKEGNKIVQELLKKKIAVMSEGAVITDLNKYNLGVWVLLRKDRTVLYSAKDLGLAVKKFQKFSLDKSFYVVGAAQSLYFAQLFKVLELMKFKGGERCVYIPFSEVRLPTGKMSSRTGENILYSDFIKEVTDFAKEKIKERAGNISKTDLEKRAMKISIAAIKFSMLRQHPNKNIIFSKEDALKFEGDTGPYLIYSYARAGSIIRKSKLSLKKLEIGNLEEKEKELIAKLSQFSEVVESAHKNLNPSLIANYSYQLAQIFNEFYHSCKVIGSESENFRLALVESFRQVLKNSLWLLGIETLEEM
ncbi:MAG: arginine--tRNA ligase [Candidatus Pacearchaeota archaeon]|nr:arginine--tRNA ligase [Candidatus Pacearchaeota archaeon]